MSGLLSADEVATRLGVSPSTLSKWRTRGRGPSFVKVGALVRYPAAKVDEWLDGQLRSETAGSRRQTSSR